MGGGWEGMGEGRWEGGNGEVGKRVGGGGEEGVGGERGWGRVRGVGEGGRGWSE